jgi:hypothetical protein
MKALIVIFVIIGAACVGKGISYQASVKPIDLETWLIQNRNLIRNSHRHYKLKPEWTEKQRKKAI